MPNAFLGWIAEGTAGDVLDGHPALDELIRVPRRYWKSPGEVWKMRQRLRALKFDVAIDLQCLTKSALTAWLSGARRRIGKSGEHGRELSRFINNELVEAGGTHVIEHYLSMLSALGIKNPAPRFDLPERPADANYADAFLRDSGLAGQRFAVLNPGAGWPSKMWPAARYGELAQHLFRTHGIRSIAAWGVPAEQPLADTIIAASDGHAVMAPKTSMLEFGAMSTGGTVRRFRYRSDASFGCGGNAYAEHAWPQPCRLVWSIWPDERADADSVRSRLVAGATARG